MNNDEIVSDIISLIHSTTKSNYVICSQVSSKIFSYLSQIQFKDDNPWNELNKAVERFDQNIDHPDLQQFRELIEIISICSNDCEERNYTLGRDKNTLIDSINQLRDLLKSHVNLHCFLLAKVIQQQDIRLHLTDLMNLTGMNVGNEIHGVLCDIIYLLCQIDPTFATSNVIDHSIVLNCIRIIQTSLNHIYSKDDNTKSMVISALNLLTKLLLTNEPFPVHTNSQLSNYIFLKCIFELIENNHDDDELVSTSIKFLLSFNLRFDYPHENPIMLTLVAINEQISCHELIERLILLFNRSIDPIEHKTTNSTIKFFTDLFDDQGTTSDILLSESNRRLIIEIISRELSNLSCADGTTTAYLSLLELILRNQTITSETCTRIDELQTSFRLYLSAENCLNENRFIINEIIRTHKYHFFNPMPELTTDEKPKSSEQIDLDEAENALAEKDYKTARELLEKLVKLEAKSDDEESIRIKESAILALGRVFKETKDAKPLASLIKITRPFLGLVSKAKAAKLVRTLVDLFLDMEAGTGEEVSLCQENIEWAKNENRTFLRQDLEARLIALYYDTKKYNEALILGSQLLKELKKLDDKQLLVEVQLLESKTYFALSNIQKARAALTSARTTANGIYTPPKLQASLDLQSGILHAVEDKDFKTAFSYFYEAFEGYDQINNNKGVTALKYMLLSKVMMNAPDDVNGLMSVKLALKYGGRDVDAMKAVAQASKKRSLADFQQALKDYKTELSDDPVIHSHLGTLYDNLLEQNLSRLLEPFSNVQIEHIARLINLPQDIVEKKLSQMILDRKLSGILDQGSSNVVIFDEPETDTQYQDALVIVQNMSKVVDTLFSKTKKLS